MNNKRPPTMQNNQGLINMTSGIRNTIPMASNLRIAQPTINPNPKGMTPSTSNVRIAQPTNGKGVLPATSNMKGSQPTTPVVKDQQQMPLIMKSQQPTTPTMKGQQLVTHNSKGVPPLLTHAKGIPFTSHMVKGMTPANSRGVSANSSLNSSSSSSRAIQKPPKPPQGFFCLYSKRSCHLNRLDGYEYCLKHILQDKNAPYRQCNFVSTKNGRRCPNPYPKTDKTKGEGHCFDHKRKLKSSRSSSSSHSTTASATAASLQIAGGRFVTGGGGVGAASAASSTTTKGTSASTTSSAPAENPAVAILSRLSDQYLGEPLIPQTKSFSKSSSSSSVGVGDPMPTLPVPKSWSGSESRAAKALEMESETDSDVDAMINEAAWKGDAESDAESVDSEQEDQLKSAGIYTAEEVALITREKLIRLQTLYIEQFKRLKHVMQEKRRKLIATKANEKIKYGSIYGAKTDAKEKRRLERYRAFKRYHKRSGREGLLQQQLNERRTQVSEGATYKPPTFAKCVAVVGSSQAECAATAATTATGATAATTTTALESVATMLVKGRMCGEKVVPCSKFCMRHILLDSQQRLFVPCAASKAAPTAAATLASAAAATGLGPFDDEETEASYHSVRTTSDSQGLFPNNAASSPFSSSSSSVCSIPIPGSQGRGHRSRCPLHMTLLHKEDQKVKMEEETVEGKQEKPFESLIHILKAELERRNVKLEPEVEEDTKPALMSFTPNPAQLSLPLNPTLLSSSSSTPNPKLSSPSQMDTSPNDSISSSGFISPHSLTAPSTSSSSTAFSSSTVSSFSPVSASSASFSSSSNALSSPASFAVPTSKSIDGQRKFQVTNQRRQQQQQPLQSSLKGNQPPSQNQQDRSLSQPQLPPPQPTPPLITLPQLPHQLPPPQLPNQLPPPQLPHQLPPPHLPPPQHQQRKGGPAVKKHQCQIPLQETLKMRQQKLQSSPLLKVDTKKSNTASKNVSHFQVLGMTPLTGTSSQLAIWTSGSLSLIKSDDVSSNSSKPTSDLNTPRLASTVTTGSSYSSPSSIASSYIASSLASVSSTGTSLPISSMNLDLTVTASTSLASFAVTISTATALSSKTASTTAKPPVAVTSPSKQALSTLSSLSAPPDDKIERDGAPMSLEAETDKPAMTLESVSGSLAENRDVPMEVDNQDGDSHVQTSGLGVTSGGITSGGLTSGDLMSGRLPSGGLISGSQISALDLTKSDSAMGVSKNPDISRESAASRPMKGDKPPSTHDKLTSMDTMDLDAGRMDANAQMNHTEFEDDASCGAVVEPTDLGSKRSMDEDSTSNHCKRNSTFGEDDLIDENSLVGDKSSKDIANVNIFNQEISESDPAVTDKTGPVLDPLSSASIQPDPGPNPDPATLNQTDAGPDIKPRPASANQTDAAPDIKSHPTSLNQTDAGPDIKSRPTSLNQTDAGLDINPHPTSPNQTDAGPDINPRPASANETDSGPDPGFGSPKAAMDSGTQTTMKSLSFLSSNDEFSDIE